MRKEVWITPGIVYMCHPNKLISINADLQRELHAIYYNKWAKNFTSRQMELIVKYLGEP